MVIVLLWLWALIWEDGGIVYCGVSHLSLFLCLGYLRGNGLRVVVYTI